MKIKNAYFNVDSPRDTTDSEFFYDDDTGEPLEAEIDNYSKIKHDEEQESD